MAGVSVAPLGGTGDLEPYIWAVEDVERDQQCFRTVFSSAFSSRGDAFSDTELLPSSDAVHFPLR